MDARAARDDEGIVSSLVSVPVILFGAGTIGRLIARQLIAKGTPPLGFADNDGRKWGTTVEGIQVSAPNDLVLFAPEAKWVATVHRTPFREEILTQLARMKVEQISLYEFLPARCDLPPERAEQTIDLLLEDEESIVEWNDQLEFRRQPSTYQQRPPRDISNVYFEDFFTHRDDEHFVDCGAADGDTIVEFMARWEKWNSIIAFEPDPQNLGKLSRVGDPEGRGRITTLGFAVSDYDGYTNFVATGDQTAHLGDGSKRVRVTTLDQMCELTSPTFIKMDIEGSELEGLWGAREIIRRYSPVLSICAYHLGDHLWQIPLLIHAIQPNYKLYFRRYLEATWELVWYAVPPDRVKR